MRVLAIDPGPAESAWVIYEPEQHTIFAKGKPENVGLLGLCRTRRWDFEHLAIEMVQHYGPDMHAGKEVFDTCVWIGRFIQACEECGVAHTPLLRTSIKSHLCGLANAKDKHIRQSIIDRFGGDTVAIGNKARPGLLHGISGDVWSALAVAITFADTRALAPAGSEAT